MTLTLIIPAYNEEERLPYFLESLAAFCTTSPDSIDAVLVVDDGSTDTTRDIATSFISKLPTLRVLSLEKNSGKGAAVQAGINAATTDAILFMDADGATQPTEIPPLAAALSASPIAVGNRWMKGSHTTGRTPLRALSSLLIRLYMGLFGLFDVDTMCGCKAFQASVAKTLFNPLLNTRWLFDQEVLFRAHLLRIPIANVPIQWESQHGSKVRISTLIAAVYEIPPLLYRTYRALPSRTTHKAV